MAGEVATGEARAAPVVASGLVPGSRREIAEGSRATLLEPPPPVLPYGKRFAASAKVCPKSR